MTDGIRGLELDKILAAAAEHAVLEESKRLICALTPTHDLAICRERLALTGEASLLLFTLGAGRVEYFPPLNDSAERAEKGATLSCRELTDAAQLLRSARICSRPRVDSKGCCMRAITITMPLRLQMKQLVSQASLQIL